MSQHDDPKSDAGDDEPAVEDLEITEEEQADVRGGFAAKGTHYPDGQPTHLVDW